MRLVEAACARGALVDAVRLLGELEARTLARANRTAADDDNGDGNDHGSGNGNINGVDGADMRALLESDEPDALDAVGDGTSRDDQWWAYWRAHRCLLDALWYGAF